LGNLNRYDEMVLIRFDGNLGNKVHVEQFRCGACQQIFTADYSQYGEDKYSALFKSKVVVDKYWSGMPFKRSETYYDMIGCPVPDATLWDLTTSITING
jgi:transposase